MPPPPHSKPENVLKRAHELIGVGQPSAALSILHEHVTSKRTRGSPIASLEPVMLLFVDLCVNLKKGKLAKDGLYQYKNIAQNANINTIQLVFKKFIELAEAKVTEAQAKADEVQSTLDQSTDSANVDDLEATETPESILLSTVSGEQSKDRTDRAIVTPWLKFLWETYRTVLDIFKNNSRLEIMYQTTARQAFQFCSKYQRKTEFRRLCELLRNHLQNVAKFGAQMHAINLNDPDTLQRHLDTRFQQLNVAVELELWQEAFRSVEDIHTLLSLSKRPAKPIMMANYFEKLTRIFLVSENYLFHAAAWSRYYNLLRQSASAMSQGGTKKDHPAVTESDMTRAASFVLLAALSIPVISTSRSRGALIDVDEARKSKNVRLTNLLGMTQAPTRALLFRDAKTKGLLSRCRPEIRELYQILEVDFHPLSICKRISPILTQIASDLEMEKYVFPLQQVILTRLFQQLSQVYESVQLEFVIGLAQFPEPFQVDSATIEKFIMNGCKKGDLAIRIDHSTGVLTFDSDVFSSAKAVHAGPGAGSAEADGGAMQRLQNTPAEIVRSQLRRLAESLFTVVQIVDPAFNEARHKQREAALERTKAGYDAERKSILARKDIIDRKKQAASSAAAQKEKDLQTQKRVKQQELLAAETQRLSEEQKERDRKRLEAERRKVQDEENVKAIEELKRGTKGIDLKSIDMDNLDSTKIRTIKIRALEKEKSELHDKLRVTGRRIDHLERAFRLEEVKHLPADYERQKESDRKAYEQETEDILRTSKEKHTEDLSLKHRLARLVPIYESFRDEIRTQRKSDFERRQKKAKQELESQIQARIKDHRERKAREKQQREEEERRRREEEERAEREAEERRQAEEERSRRLQEEKAAREEQRKALDEKGRLQRERDAAAEAKIAAKKSGLASGLGDRVPSRDISGKIRGAADAPSGERPRIALKPRTTGEGSAPTWREREAAKAAGAGSAETSLSSRPAPPNERNRDDSQEPIARRPGGYVPPARRAAGEGTDERRPGAYAPPSRRAAPEVDNGSGAEGRPTGYVPPARRGGEGAGEAPGGGWRAREAARGEGASSRREEGTREGGRESLRAPSFAPRGTSSASGAASGRDESPLPPPTGAADGKYKPGMFRKTREGGA